MVVIHCNDCFWEDIHAEVIGAGGSDVRSCDGAIGDMVHVELHGHCVGYVNVKSARVAAILDGGFDDLEGSCDGSNRFCGLHRHLDITNEYRWLVLVFRFDHNVRERARLGMAECVHDIIRSSEIGIGNWDSQLGVLDIYH